MSKEYVTSSRRRDSLNASFAESLQREGLSGCRKRMSPKKIAKPSDAFFMVFAITIM